MSKIIVNNPIEKYASLPLYFSTACDFWPQESKKRLATTPFYQILFVVSGNGVLTCNSNTYALKKGCAFFTAQGVAAEYINTNGLVTAFLTAHGMGVKLLSDIFTDDGFLFYESINVEKYVYDIKEIINEYYTHKRDAILSAMAYSFYAKFFQEQNKELTKLDEIIIYIENNFKKRLTLEQLANISHISVSKLSHDFKNHFNVSVFQYILNLRLTYARNLLFSDQTILTKNAAFSSGFDDVSYFCRAYKAKFGKSPSKDQKSVFKT